MNIKIQTFFLSISTRIFKSLNLMFQTFRILNQEFSQISQQKFQVFYFCFSNQSLPPPPHSVLTSYRAPFQASAKILIASQNHKIGLELRLQQVLKNKEYFIADLDQFIVQEFKDVYSSCKPSWFRLLVCSWFVLAQNGFSGWFFTLQRIVSLHGAKTRLRSLFFITPSLLFKQNAIIQQNRRELHFSPV